MTSAPSVAHPCENGVQRPRASCSTAEPAKVPLKPATSSLLRTSAFPRSISQTTLTVENEGEGGRGEAGIGQCTRQALEPGRLPSLLSWGRKAVAAVGAANPHCQQDILPFCPGQGGLGSMETTASSCSLRRWRVTGAVRRTECRQLVPWERPALAAFLVLQPGAWIPAGNARQPSH